MQPSDKTTNFTTKRINYSLLHAFSTPRLKLSNKIYSEIHCLSLLKQIQIIITEVELGQLSKMTMLQKAIEIVTKATEEDTAGNYQKAFQVVLLVFRKLKYK